MASLTVRQLDEKLKKRLRLRAAKSGRSVEDEVRTILREAAGQTDDETRTAAELTAASTSNAPSAGTPPTKPPLPSTFRQHPNKVREPRDHRCRTAPKRCCSSSVEALQPTSRSI